MRILNSKQVKYCQLIRHTNDNQEIFPGVIYQDKLFVKVGSYPKEQAQTVISSARNKFLTDKGKILYLVVEEDTKITIWSEDNTVQLFEENQSQPDIVSSINLKKLVADMRDVGGVKIKDRRYKLKNYPQCFVGSEAVGWMTKKLNISPEEALKIGQRLIEEKWIHHVTNEHPFENGYFFYRFYWDE